MQTKFPIRYFVHQGRKYRIYKRSDSPSSPWYIKAGVNGRQKQVCLETANAAAAEKRAAIHVIKPMQDARWSEVGPTNPNGPGSPLIGTVLETYARRGGEFVKDRTLRDVQNTFEKFAAEALRCHRAKVRERRVSDLTESAVEHWKSSVVKDRADGLTGDAASEERQSAKYYANRILSVARSVFSTHMLRVYKAEGLKTLPTAIAELMAVPLYAKIRVHRERANDAVLDRTITAAENLDAESIELYNIFWCIIATGMRKSEILSARWEWFQQIDGHLAYLSETIGKDGARVQVPVIKSGWAMLQRHAKAEGPVIPSNGQQHFKRFGKWMAELGWNTSKKAHELRNLVASRVISRHGLGVGSKFMRHKDQKTTEQFYSSYMKFAPIDIDLRS